MSATIRLERLVELEASRAADFAALTEVCEGAWPGEVLRILAGRSDADALRLLAGVGRSSGRVGTDRRLPLAHPLDADWRFTRASAECVLDVALSSATGGDILLIAMPTVALAAYDRGLVHRVVVGSRLGDPIDLALRAAMPDCRFIDLREVPAGAFQAAALDPPWYDDVALPLIDVAQDAVISGGHVLVCAPDHLTAPSSAQRLSALLDNPPALGFSATAFIDRVRYATPFFELRCLKAAGIANVSPQWRTGLLYLGTPAPRSQVRRSLRADNDGWREVRQGAVRVWMRPCAPHQDGEEVAVSRSISRTDRLREIATVWTSGNTYVATVGPAGPEMVQGTADSSAYPAWWPQFQAALLDERAAMEQVVDYL